MEPSITLTEAQLKDVIRDTVNETLTTLGVDVKNPLEMQADFQAIREWREVSATVRKKGLAALMVVLVTGLCSILWLGFKEYIN